MIITIVHFRKASYDLINKFIHEYSLSLPFHVNSSTSNIKVAFAGILGGDPLFP